MKNHEVSLPTVEQIAFIASGNIVIVDNGNSKELFIGPSRHAAESPYGKCPCEAVRVRSGKLTLCLSHSVAKKVIHSEQGGGML